MSHDVLIVTALAGFARSFLMDDIATLQSMGYVVHCAANANHPGADDVVNFLKKKNVIFHQVDFSSSKPLSKNTLQSFFELQKISSEYDFCLVHCHTPIAGAICRLVFEKQRRWKGVSVIYTTHGFYFHKKSSRKTWLIFRSIEDWMSRFTDVMITINHEDFDNAKKMHCNNVKYIPGVGVNLERFRSVQIDRDAYRKTLGLKPKDFVILAVGEISHRKNQKIIVEALALCHIPRAVFVICGNTITGLETKKEIEEEATNRGIDVRFLGLRKDIPQICKCADVGVLPSLREGLGLAGIEMLAAGLPVIGADVHGIPDYIFDGVNGYLADPTDPGSFAEALKKISDSKIRKSMSERCSESVQSFDIACSHKAMSKIYNEILERTE